MLCKQCTLQQQKIHDKIGSEARKTKIGVGKVRSKNCCPAILHHFFNSEATLLQGILSSSYACKCYSLFHTVASYSCICSAEIKKIPNKKKH